MTTAIASIWTNISSLDVAQVAKQSLPIVKGATKNRFDVLGRAAIDDFKVSYGTAGLNELPDYGRGDIRVSARRTHMLRAISNLTADVKLSTVASNLVAEIFQVFPIAVFQIERKAFGKNGFELNIGGPPSPVGTMPGRYSRVECAVRDMRGAPYAIRGFFQQFLKLSDFPRELQQHVMRRGQVKHLRRRRGQIWNCEHTLLQNVSLSIARSEAA